MKWNRCDLEKAIQKAGDYLLAKADSDEIKDSWFGHESTPPFKTTSNTFLNFFLVKGLKSVERLDGWLTDKIFTELDAYKVGDQYSYTVGAPVDADDTAFALRTLHLLGQTITHDRVSRALAPFYSNGKWLTFDYDIDMPEAMPWVSRHINDASIVGPHPEVFLNVLCLLNEIGDDADLIPKDLPVSNNCITTYHYLSNLYSNWLLSCITPKTETFFTDKDILNMFESNGLCKGIEKGFNQHLETSLAILTLNSQEAMVSIDKTVKVICDCQQDDGSWPSGFLWKYYVTSEGGGGFWYGKDNHNILSTSLMLLALSHISVSA